MTTEQLLDLNVQHVDQGDHSSESFLPVARRIARVAKKKVHSNDESLDDSQPDILIGGDDRVDKSNTTAAAASVDKPESDQVTNSLASKKFKAMDGFDDIEEDDSSSVNSESGRSSHSASDGEDDDSDSSIEFIGTYRPTCPVHSKKSIASVENKAIDIEVEKVNEEKKSDFKIDDTKSKAIELSNDDVHFENSNDGLDREPETNKKPKI